MSPILSSILFGALAAGVAAAALLLARVSAGFTRANAPIFAAFAGGILVTLALAHLLPRALEITPNAPWWVLAGFAGGFLLHALSGGAAHHPERFRRAAALAPVLAIGVHSILDGVVYAVTFAVDPLAGIGAASGLVLHEFPEALVCFVLLQRAGLGDRSSLVLAFLTAGVTTFAAAAIAAPYAGALGEERLGILFAIAAGLLLQVGSARVTQEAAEHGAFKTGAAVIAGAGVAAALVTLHGDHDHHHGHSHGEASAHRHEPAEIDGPDFRPAPRRGPER
ncbi:MAG: ZIP family metal transporter [Oceanicaulis sp.]